ncbi:iron chelate uptake ABC transporter family permease subunit [candidate division WOR-3 bacterium]|uniref:Iron chelate uptake ABC transporter family permease subunit n=1 Tax=candidate division WOR-3 bacterium TaxID=2052148 RepID=A0A9D5K8J7_UNCW3|nr:iron chelate uptake ABC transporter family permease subunit [candidate division WOR-3 bacterium]MBD3364074.1 iron chelate uptake ABC transporter family permease subunit [candidate division WOR-3 bacterium]
MRYKLGWITLPLLLTGLIILALFIGERSDAAVDTHSITILFKLRITRILLAIFAGGVLAVVGAALQGLLQNPLVDPYIIGTSSGAGVGVALSVMLGWSTALGLTPVIGHSIFGFAGALAALFLVYALARIRGKFSRLSLILAGVAVGFVGSGIITVLIAFARNEGFQRLIYLLMGDVSGKWLSAPETLALGIGGLISIAGCIWLTARWRSLDVVSTNIEAAESIGVDTQRLTVEVFLISSLLVGLVVSFVGAISFVGLIVPHIVRFIFGPRHSRVLPASFLAGAILLLAADIILKGINLATIDMPNPVILPLSVVTTLVGVPVFLYLMRRRTS